MPVSVHAGWDFEKIGSFSITITDAGGTTAIEFSSGTYANIDIDDVIGATDTGYLPFAAQLQTSINLYVPFTGVFTVTYSATTNKYTISSTAAFTITGTSSGTTLAAKILGLTGDVSSTTSKTSDRQVYYSVLSASNGFSNDTDVYEPDGIVEVAEADDGTHYATSRATSPKYRNFELQNNSKATTLKASETSTLPYSMERLYEHTRAQYPIGFWDSARTAGIVAYQRADGASHRPQRVIPNSDLYWTWPFRLRYLGTITSIT